MEKTIKGLYAIIDTDYVKSDSLEKTVLDIISGGARIIQLRAKGVGAKEFLRQARLVRKITLERGVTFIINDRVDVALITEADGVHLGQDDLPLDAARRLLGRKKLIGLSTHNLKQAIDAGKTTADYISVGPIFQTRSKPDACQTIGIKNLKKIRKNTTLPIAAIGGITEESVIAVLKEGADCVAMISEILLSKDIMDKTQRLSAIIEKSRTTPLS